MEDQARYGREGPGFRHRVERTGDAPLELDGIELAAIEGAPARRAKRGESAHGVRVYQTTGGRLVAAVSYRTTMASERSWSGVFEAVSLRALRGELRGYDPAARMSLPPVDDRAPGAAAKRERDEAARRAVRDQWGDVLEELWAKLEFVDTPGEPTRCLSARGAAELKGCSSSTVGTAVSEGALSPAVVIESLEGDVRAYGFLRAEVEAWEPRPVGWTRGRSRMSPESGK